MRWLLLLLACRTAGRPPQDGATTEPTGATAHTGGSEHSADTTSSGHTGTIPPGWLTQAAPARYDGDVEHGWLGHRIEVAGEHLLVGAPNNWMADRIADGGRVLWLDDDLQLVAVSATGREMEAELLGYSIEGIAGITPGGAVYVPAGEWEDKRIEWYPEGSSNGQLLIGEAARGEYFDAHDINGDGEPDLLLTWYTGDPEEARMSWMLGPLGEQVPRTHEELPDFRVEGGLSWQSEIAVLHQGEDLLVTIGRNEGIFLARNPFVDGHVVAAAALEPLLFGVDDEHVVPIELASGEECVLVGYVLGGERDGEVHLACPGDGGVPRWTLRGSDHRAFLGFDLAVGDVDGDGYQDAIVGAPRDPYDPDAGKGKIHIWLGPLDQAPTEATTITVEGETKADRFGFQVAYFPREEDVAIAVGADRTSYAETEGGSVYLLPWELLSELDPR